MKRSIFSRFHSIQSIRFRITFEHIQATKNKLESYESYFFRARQISNFKCRRLFVKRAHTPSNLNNRSESIETASRDRNSLFPRLDRAINRHTTGRQFASHQSRNCGAEAISLSTGFFLRSITTETSKESKRRIASFVSFALYV